MTSKLNVVFESNNYIIIDKPSGITVNRSDTTSGETTLQDLILENKIINEAENDEEFVKRAGIVHRLDKETSGALIIAKNAKSFNHIQAQFKERGVEKSYLALSHGLPKSKKGEIIAPVGRLPWNRKRFGIIAQGREAATKYEVLSIKYLVSKEKKEPLSLIRLFPKTGRTHQIRVHLKHIGHPIFSDPIYSGRKTARADRKVLPRIFLHAEEISFNDPETGERVRFKVPLPKELNDFLKKLKKLEN